MKNNMDLQQLKQENKQLKRRNRILNTTLTIFVFLIYISMILTLIQIKRLQVEMVDNSCETCEDIFHATCIGKWADTLKELNLITRKNERSALSSVGWGIPPIPLMDEGILEKGNVTINITFD